MMVFYLDHPPVSNYRTVRMYKLVNTIIELLELYKLVNTIISVHFDFFMYLFPPQSYFNICLFFVRDVRKQCNILVVYYRENKIIKQLILQKKNTENNLTLY